MSDLMPNLPRSEFPRNLEEIKSDLKIKLDRIVYTYEQMIALNFQAEGGMRTLNISAKSQLMISDLRDFLIQRSEEKPVYQNLIDNYLPVELNSQMTMLIANLESFQNLAEAGSIQLEATSTGRASLSDEDSLIVNFNALVPAFKDAREEVKPFEEAIAGRLKQLILQRPNYSSYELDPKMIQAGSLLRHTSVSFVEMVGGSDLAAFDDRVSRGGIPENLVHVVYALHDFLIVSSKQSSPRVNDEQPQEMNYVEMILHKQYSLIFILFKLRDLLNDLEDSQLISLTSLEAEQMSERNEITDLYNGLGTIKTDLDEVIRNLES